MDKIHKKKVEQIANFIVNNITLAEVSSMVIERATETAEFIVQNGLDPNDFNSPVARKKLHKKIIIEKGRVIKVKEEKWYHSLLKKMGYSNKKKKKPIKEGSIRTRKL